MAKFKTDIFWLEDVMNAEAIKTRSTHYRTVELNKFIQRVETDHGRVVGVRFEDNNVELIVLQDILEDYRDEE